MPHSIFLSLKRFIHNIINWFTCIPISWLMINRNSNSQSVIVKSNWRRKVQQISQKQQLVTIDNEGENYLKTECPYLQHPVIGTLFTRQNWMCTHTPHTLNLVFTTILWDRNYYPILETRNKSLRGLSNISVSKPLCAWQSKMAASLKTARI